MKVNNIGVHIKVKDFQKSKVFYEALGFTQVFAYGPDQAVKEAYNGVVFEHGGAKLEIADGHRSVKLSVFQEEIKSSKISLMITVDSIEAVIRRCKKNGIQIAVQPRHYYWGTLELVIKDPDGTVLVFIAPYSVSEAKKVKADKDWATQPTLA